jgi:hypothetical protein
MAFFTGMAVSMAKASSGDTGQSTSWPPFQYGAVRVAPLLIWQPTGCFKRVATSLIRLEPRHWHSVTCFYVIPWSKSSHTLAQIQGEGDTDPKSQWEACQRICGCFESVLNLKAKKNCLVLSGLCQKMFDDLEKGPWFCAGVGLLFLAVMFSQYIWNR